VIEPSRTAATAARRATASTSRTLVARCRDTDADGGRCQLHIDHNGSHASCTDDACLTWFDGEIYRWRRHPPPHWVLDLPWIPGLRPTPDHEAI
jgi:hypothetical protein